MSAVLIADAGRPGAAILITVDGIASDSPEAGGLGMPGDPRGVGRPRARGHQSRGRLPDAPPSPSPRRRPWPRSWTVAATGSPAGAWQWPRPPPARESRRSRSWSPPAACLALEVDGADPGAWARATVHATAAGTRAAAAALRAALAAAAALGRAS